jgi:outer membrane lipoprotein-sorting protein
MIRKTFVSCVVFSVFAPLALVGADTPMAPATLTVAQIVEKNVAAKGGLQTWRAVQTMSISGKMDAGGTNNVQLPFVLEMKRPRKSRIEIEFGGKTAVQVYDGVNGWKVRPFLGHNDAEPFTTEEMKKASQEQDLDGPLVDYVAKGTKLELEGTEQVEGRDAYKLKLTLKNGEMRRVWVDAQTFLDVKIDGTRRLDGKPHSMATYLHGYKSVQGLMVAHFLETTVEGVKGSEKMTIERVVVNPKLEDSLFGKPKIK